MLVWAQDCRSTMINSEVVQGNGKEPVLSNQTSLNPAGLNPRPAVS